MIRCCTSTPEKPQLSRTHISLAHQKYLLVPKKWHHGDSKFLILTRTFHHWNAIEFSDFGSWVMLSNITDEWWIFPRCRKGGGIPSFLQWNISCSLSRSLRLMAVCRPIKVMMKVGANMVQPHVSMTWSPLLWCVSVLCVRSMLQASPGYRRRERRCTRLLQSDLYCELASVKPILMTVSGDTTLPESGTQYPE